MSPPLDRERLRKALDLCGIGLAEGGHPASDWTDALAGEYDRLSRESAEEALASWRRRAEYAEAVTKRICTCPWAPNDGPRQANAPDCPIHAPLRNRTVAP